MANKEVNGIALGAMVGGLVFAYSGLKGKGVAAVIRNIIAGKDPNLVPQTGAIGIIHSGTAGGNSTPVSFTNSSSALVSTARNYLGMGYSFGGWTPGHWDCSGAMNWWLGHDLGQTLPLGTKWSGNWHGPIAANYLVWTALQTIPRAQAAPGDLACWPTHVAVVSGSNNMISAYSSSRGTVETAIDGMGPSGEPLSIRRFKTGGTITI